MVEGQVHTKENRLVELRLLIEADRMRLYIKLGHDIEDGECAGCTMAQLFATGGNDITTRTWQRSSCVGMRFKKAAISQILNS